jgi:4-amino-4-deoxy-L-arabinose transferase-like glycosyltransferase
MNELILKTSLVFLICLFTWISWKYANKYRIALASILILALVLRAYMSSNSQLHQWDERYHALVAKNLSENPSRPTLYAHPVLPYEKNNWVGNHIWLAKPPVALWGMAASIKIFGPTEFAVRLPSLIYGLLAIVLTYLIGSILFDSKTGIWAAWLHAIHGVLIQLGAGMISSDHVETAHVFYVELSVFLMVFYYFKKQAHWILLLAGAAGGLAFLSKWHPALLVFALWFILAALSKKYSIKQIIVHGLIFIGGFLLLTLPWISYMFYEFPEEASHVFGKLSQAYIVAAEDHAASPFYYVLELLYLYGEAVFLILILALVWCFKNNSRLQILLLLVWALMPAFAFSFAETKRFTYLLISAPAFFILTAHVWLTLKEKWQPKKLNFFKPLLLFVLAILPLRLLVERLRFFEAEKEPTLFYQNITIYEQQLDSNDLVFGLEEHIELMFYSDVYSAYRDVPADSVLTNFEADGYDVYVMREYELQAYE